jgi:hypothetical protein
MLEYAFVQGVNAQREVSETRPDHPLLVKERKKEEAIAKLMFQPGPLEMGHTETTLGGALEHAKCSQRRSALGEVGRFTHP